MRRLRYLGHVQKYPSEARYEMTENRDALPGGARLLGTG